MKRGSTPSCLQTLAAPPLHVLGPLEPKEALVSPLQTRYLVLSCPTTLRSTAPQPKPHPTPQKEPVSHAGNTSLGRAQSREPKPGSARTRNRTLRALAPLSAHYSSRRWRSTVTGPTLSHPECKKHGRATSLFSYTQRQISHTDESFHRIAITSDQGIRPG